MKRISKNKTIVKCITCKHAVLYGYGTDPVIADCKKHGDRQVANAPRVCDDYIEELNKQIIQHS